LSSNQPSTQPVLIRVDFGNSAMPRCEEEAIANLVVPTITL
jgi:hypothetical protein